MRKSTKVFAILIIATSLAAIFTGVVFVQNTSALVQIVGNETYYEGALQIGVNMSLPTAFYDSMPTSGICRVQIKLPQGPMNVTVRSLEIILHTYDVNDPLDTSPLWSTNIFYTPFLLFNNTQTVSIQENLTIVPKGSSPMTTMTRLSVLVDTEASNSTVALGVSGGPIVKATQVYGILLNPLCWGGIDIFFMAIFGFSFWKHRKYN